MPPCNLKFVGDGGADTQPVRLTTEITVTGTVLMKWFVVQWNFGLVF